MLPCMLVDDGGSFNDSGIVDAGNKSLDDNCSVKFVTSRITDTVGISRVAGIERKLCCFSAIGGLH